MDEIIITSPETGSGIQHTLIRDIRFYCVIGQNIIEDRVNDHCFVPEECKIQIQKATDNKWWYFISSSVCSFLELSSLSLRLPFVRTSEEAFL